MLNDFCRNKTKIYLIIILIIGFSIYTNSLTNNFVWDDEEQIVNNSIIRTGDNLPLFFTASTFYSGGINLSGGFYRPLATLSYFLNYSFWELNPVGFHLFQIFFHLLNLILIFFLFKKILDEERTKNSEEISFLSSLLFAVHPVNVESVVYIGSIGEILYSFFILSSFYLFLKGIDYETGEIKKNTFIYSFSLIFLSLLAKESGIVAFPLLLLYLFLFIKPKREIYKKFLISTGITLSAYSFLRYFIAKISTVSQHYAPISLASFWERISALPYTVFSYLKIIFFPKDLFISRHFLISSFADIKFWTPFILLSGVLIFSFYLIFKKKSIISLFFLLWFLGCLFPTLNIIPLDMTMAERWLYFPLIGFIGLFVFLVFKYFNDNNLKKQKLYFCFFLIITIFSFRVIIRNRDWKDGLTLYGHDILYSKNSFDLENNYGVELFRIGEIDKAKEHFQRSIFLQPEWMCSHNNLGAVYQRQGEIDKAKEEYTRSLELGDYYFAYENLATILLREKDEKALEFLEQGFLKFPRSLKLRRFLSIAYYRNGENQKAINLLLNIIEKNPQDSVSNYILGVIRENKEIVF